MKKTLNCLVIHGDFSSHQNPEKHQTPGMHDLFIFSKAWIISRLQQAKMPIL